MSHFTVTVRVTAKRLAKHGGDYNAALEEMLAPYDENNESLYTEFVDNEIKYRKEYDEEAQRWLDLGQMNDVSSTGEVVVIANAVIGEHERIHNGHRIVLPYHDMFRNKGAGLFEPQYKSTDHLTEIQVPFRELYATFEQFVAEYHGEAERDPKHGRYGHMRHPHARWDWWTIGGRWRGHFPVKPGVDAIIGEPGVFNNEPEPDGADVVRIDEIDFDAVATRHDERFATFCREYRDLIAGRKFPAFEGPRDRAIDLGLVRVERDPAAELAPDELQIGGTWGEDHPSIASENGPNGRANWRDIGKSPSGSALERYRSAFNPLKTYAALDDDGWHEPGKMGWFGVNHSTPDTYMAYADAFTDRFIETAQPGDLLICIDCHI